MINGALFSSKKDEWETPQWLFDKLDSVFHFDLDVCATKENAKCKQYFTKEDDGLKQAWLAPACWMNPPYGREIIKWIDKAYVEYMTRGCNVVCLLPARTDTKWFHDYIYHNSSAVQFLRGRLKFGGSKNSAPFPSMLCVYGHKHGIERLFWKED